MSEQVEDMVNCPKHYTSFTLAAEPILICEHLSFCLGNAVKYILRAGLKGSPEKELEDYKKAEYYIVRETAHVVSHEAKFAFNILKDAFPEDKRTIVEQLLSNQVTEAFIKVRAKIEELENKFNESK